MAQGKAWSCQDLVDHAHNWSLAGNVGLLKHMEQFAEDLFTKAEETDRDLNSLLKDLDATSVQLDLVKNHFLGLQNTQFIESRVYEDDEVLETGAKSSDLPAAEANATKLSDESKRKMVKQAILDGLEVLDKCYDRVCIPKVDSDSEDNVQDEADNVDYMLRAKNPYVHRPLPFIIGTREWHSKWHAGLLDSSDEEEEANTNGQPKVEDEDFSCKPTPSQERTNVHLPIDNNAPTFYPDKNRNSNAGDFASNFTVKLGPVDPGHDPEVNTRPIQKKVPAKDVLFPVEHSVPPPMEAQGLDVHENAQIPAAGLFSGGGGLFDDDEIVVKPPPMNSHHQKAKHWFDEDDNDIFEEQKTGSPEMQPPPLSNRSAKSKSKRGLFDETDDEDEDFLVTPGGASGVEFMRDTPPKEPKTVEEKTKVLSLFDDDDLFEEDFFSTSDLSCKPPPIRKDTESPLESVAKSPPDGILVVSNLKSNANAENESDSSSLGRNKTSFDSSSEIKPRTKVRNLFDESEDEEDNDLFQQAPLPIPKPVIPARKPEIVGEKPNLRNKTSDQILPENEVSQVSKKLPGKLTHSLNINVESLKPGARSMRLKVEESNDEENCTFPDVPRSFSSNVIEGSVIAAPPIEDASLEGVRVLQSVTKDRVRVGVKRRPSTRTGRQAALGKSGIFDSPENCGVLENITDPDQDQDEEKLNTDDSFESYHRPPSLNSLGTEAKKNISLFDDLDDDLDDSNAIFSSNRNSPSKKQIILNEETGNLQLEEPPPISDHPDFDSKKVNLFDDLGDGSEEEDLFAPMLGTSSNVSNVRVFETVSPRSFSKAETKEESNDIFEDLGKPRDRSEDHKKPELLTGGKNKLNLDDHPRRRNQVNLFDDVDDDDEFERVLFGGLCKSSIKTESSKGNLFEHVENGDKKRSLFEDDDDCDSLFGSSSKPKVMTSANSASSRTSSLVSSTNRIKATTRDPLAALIGGDSE